MTLASLRLCDRYLNEVVLAFELCPWAEPALRSGRVARHVSLALPALPEHALAFLDDIDGGREQATASPQPQIEIGLLMFPRFSGGWAAFDSFAERVRKADRARRDAAALMPFLVAMFHPDGPAELPSGPNRMLAFLRRSPDPMLQFVRASAVDHMKERQPELSDQVAQHNWMTLGDPAGPRRGAELAAALQSIRQDRDETYARLIG